MVGLLVLQARADLEFRSGQIRLLRQLAQQPFAQVAEAPGDASHLLGELACLLLLAHMGIVEHQPHDQAGHKRGVCSQAEEVLRLIDVHHPKQGNDATPEQQERHCDSDYDDLHSGVSFRTMQGGEKWQLELA